MEWIIAFLGFLIHIVLGMVKTKRKHPDRKFSPIVYLKDELFTAILGVLSIIAMMLIKVDVMAIIKPEYIKLGMVMYLAIGFFNYALLDRVMNIAIPKKFRE